MSHQINFSLRGGDATRPPQYNWPDLLILFLTKAFCTTGFTIGFTTKGLTTDGASNPLFLKSGLEVSGITLGITTGASVG